MSHIQPDTTKQPPQIKGVYIALITQIGTDAPTAIVIKNTMPTLGQPVWTRSAAGAYRLTSTETNYFPPGLVTFTFANNTAGQSAIRMVHNTHQQVTIVTQTGAVLTDGILGSTPIEIIIWDRIHD